MGKQVESLEIRTGRRRERSSIIFYLHGHGMSFRDIGKCIGQVHDATKPMGIAHVHGLYKGEVRRRERLAKEYRREQKQFGHKVSLTGKGVDRMEQVYREVPPPAWPTIKDKVKAEIDLRKSLDRSKDFGC